MLRICTCSYYDFLYSRVKILSLYVVNGSCDEVHISGGSTACLSDTAFCDLLLHLLCYTSSLGVWQLCYISYEERQVHRGHLNFKLLYSACAECVHFSIVFYMCCFADSSICVCILFTAAVVISILHVVLSVIGVVSLGLMAPRTCTVVGPL